MAELLFFGLPDGEGQPAADALASMQQRLAQLSLGGQPGTAGAADAAAGTTGDAAAAAAAAAGSVQWLAFDSSREYLYQDCLHGLEGRPPGEATLAPAAGEHPADQQAQQAQQEGDPQQVQQQQQHYGPQWAYLRFSQPVTAAADSLVIGSKLDAGEGRCSCNRGCSVAGLAWD